MTHYNVMVIGPAEHLEEALAPFDENLDVEPYFQPVKDAFRTAVEQQLGHTPTETDLLPHIEEWYARPGELRNGVAGYVTTRNPKSKWDYWSCLPLLTRDGRKAVHLTKKELDIASILTAARDEAKHSWETVSRIGTLYVRELFGVTDNDTETTYIERYVAETARKPLPVYAVLGEGVWREPGEVGWFGATSATDDDQEKFNRWFEQFWAELDDDTPFTLVDCHI